LAVAVFGALLASQATFMQGLRTSLLLAAGVALAAAAVSLLLQPARSGRDLEVAPAWAAPGEGAGARPGNASKPGTGVR
jgi:hypothetical protein